MLQQALLHYGTSSYAVQPSEMLPLPVEFDFTDPVTCGRLISAIMCNAGGGHTLRECKVRIHRKRRTALILSSGTFVFYRDPDVGRITVEEALQVEKEIETFTLGAVRSDPYGEGWKRAVWS